MKKKPVKINRQLACNLLKVVDKGLTDGMGNPEPGQMCVEAAVCYALGLPHGDEPNCVNKLARQLKITVNDGPWPDKMARARGLRRAAIAQLGSKGAFTNAAFLSGFVSHVIRVFVPMSLRAAIRLRKEEGVLAFAKELEQSACRCALEGTTASARAACAFIKNIANEHDDASYLGYPDGFLRVITTRKRVFQRLDNTLDDIYRLSGFTNSGKKFVPGISHYIQAVTAELCVQTLIDLKSPGAKWLTLAPLQLPNCPHGIEPYKPHKGRNATRTRSAVKHRPAPPA